MHSQPYRSFRSEASSRYMGATEFQPAFQSSVGNHDKMFFDIEYIFQDPTPIKRRRYHIQPTIRNHQRTGDRKYKTLDERGDVATSIVLKADQALMKVQPVSEKQMPHMQTTDLFFNKNSKEEAIHARKMTLNSSLFKALSSKRADKSPATQKTQFEGLLSSKNYSACHQNRSIERQKRICKIERQAKRVQAFNGGEKGVKKGLKVQSEEFRKYCERNIELAKNAFLLRNKQTIRIYRPWSPVNLEEGFNQFQFEGPA